MTDKKDPHAELMRLADVYAGPEIDSICLERKTLADFARTLTDRIAELQNLAERLKLEAQIHAGEARAANSTISEIYQCVSGATGEPGNWHGAEPVRQRIAELEAELAQTVEPVKIDWARVEAAESRALK